MRKRGRQHSHRKAPPMVVMNIDDMLMKHNMAVTMIKCGTGGAAHYNAVNDCYDLLRLSGAPRGDIDVVLDVASEAIGGIKERYERTKKIGCTGEEGKALSLLVNFSEDFWRRQTGTRFIDAARRLDELREEQAGATT